MSCGVTEMNCVSTPVRHLAAVDIEKHRTEGGVRGIRLRYRFAHGRFHHCGTKTADRQGGIARPHV
ncbi:hypothetical protein AB0M48_12775 [Lentzea sp. NPDC051208]|uniref:hypothetical protein n=1 Tax=Lentzea sp. NPDC051208 TaxID=3154642 RepID=UPI003440D5DE